MRLKDMTDEHLANTIRFLRVRGYRTPGEIAVDPLSRYEAEIAGCPGGDEKLAELVLEQMRRTNAKLSSFHDSQPTAG